MAEIIIDVANVESLQMTHDVDELDRIFTKAKSIVVQGGTVVLARKSRQGAMERFDEISTEADLNTYRETVYKYL